MVALSVVALAPLCFMVSPPMAMRAAVTTTASVSPVPRFANLAMEAASDVEEICDVIPDVCQQIEADADAVFSVIDENGDGGISRVELMQHLTKAGYKTEAVNMLFDKLDTNKDDELSREELRAGFLQYTPLRSAPGLGAYNMDFITEIHADADALFNAIDVDGNGSISKDELREHLKRVSEYSFKAISNMFKLLDVNKDGAVEKEELRDAFVKYSALRQAIGEGPNFK